MEFCLLNVCLSVISNGNCILKLKLNAEYGGIRSTTAQPPNHANLAAQQVPQASTTLALTGIEPFVL